jgi:hypothetical protein
VIRCLDSPRVMILNAQLTSDVRETVIVKCHVCSIPELIQINWFRHEQNIGDVNVLIKTHPTDHQHCSESIMEIVVRSDHLLFLSAKCKQEKQRFRSLIGYE